MKKPFLDFYSSIGFAPTGQKVGTSVIHQQNRTNLYRKLGLHPQILKGARVLEIGPGSGENSVDLLKRGISALKLIDGVPEVLNSLKTSVSGKIPVTFEVCDASIPFSSTETFEIVICEGVIPLQLNPIDFFRNISKMVTPGGFIMITTMDGISTLSEILRRVSSHLLFQIDKSSTETLAQFFKDDFLSLGNMSRKPSNWVLDSIVNPWIGKMFSIEDALTAVAKDFRPISMTPNLHLDFDWYKTINNNESEIGKWITSYRKSCHHLIDYRVNSGCVSNVELNHRLDQLCSRIFLEMQALVSGNLQGARNHISESLKSITEECSQLDIITKESLGSYIEFLNADDPNLLMKFRPFWGRGQQYMLFQRDQE